MTKANMRLRRTQLPDSASLIKGDEAQAEPAFLRGPGAPSGKEFGGLVLA